MREPDMKRRLLFMVFITNLLFTITASVHPVSWNGLAHRLNGSFEFGLENGCAFWEQSKTHRKSMNAYEGPPTWDHTVTLHDWGIIVQYERTKGWNGFADTFSYDLVTEQSIIRRWQAALWPWLLVSSVY